MGAKAFVMLASVRSSHSDHYSGEHWRDWQLHSCGEETKGQQTRRRARRVCPERTAAAKIPHPQRRSRCLAGCPERDPPHAAVLPRPDTLAEFLTRIVQDATRDTDTGIQGTRHFED